MQTWPLFIIRVCLVVGVTGLRPEPRWEEPTLPYAFGIHSLSSNDDSTGQLPFGDPDFEGIVEQELDRRMPDITESCKECVEGLAVQACKTAWDKLKWLCKNHANDSDYGRVCDKWMHDPADFLVNQVLRAAVNPIDAGSSICYWRSKCNQSKKPPDGTAALEETPPSLNAEQQAETAAYTALKDDFPNAARNAVNKRLPSFLHEDERGWRCHKCVAIHARRALWVEVSKLRIMCAEGGVEFLPREQRNLCGSMHTNPQMVCDKVLDQTPSLLATSRRLCYSEQNCPHTDLSEEGIAHLAVPTQSPESSDTIDEAIVATVAIAAHRFLAKLAPEACKKCTTQMGVRLLRLEVRKLVFECENGKPYMPQELRDRCGEWDVDTKQEALCQFLLARADVVQSAFDVCVMVHQLCSPQDKA